MSSIRKMKRKDKHLTSCCGKQMLYKEGYGVYVCEKCGKEKILKESKKGINK